MTEKYYDYEHITEVLKSAIEIIKVAEEFDMSPIGYEVSALAPYMNYEIYIKIHYSDYHEISIQETESSCIDYYKVSLKDHSVEYSHSYNS